MSEAAPAEPVLTNRKTGESGPASEAKAAAKNEPKGSAAEAKGDAKTATTSAVPDLKKYMPKDMGRIQK